MLFALYYAVYHVTGNPYNQDMLFQWSMSINIDQCQNKNSVIDPKCGSIMIGIGVNATKLIWHWLVLISIDHWYSMSCIIIFQMWNSDPHKKYFCKFIILLEWTIVSGLNARIHEKWWSQWIISYYTPSEFLIYKRIYVWKCHIWSIIVSRGSINIMHMIYFWYTIIYADFPFPISSLTMIATAYRVPTQMYLTLFCFPGMFGIQVACTQC